MLSDLVVLVGTGADEVRFGLAAAREQLERDFGQTDDVELTFDNLRINPAGDSVAFVYGDAVVAGWAGGEAFEMSGLRFTFGLIRTALGWRFAQVHVSVPNAAQDDGSSI